MRRIFFITVLAALTISLVSPAYADKIYLKNGRSIEGIIKYEDTDVVELEIKGGVVKFAKSAVEKIERARPVEAAAMRRDWLIQQAKDKAHMAAKQAEFEARPRTVDVASSGNTILVKTILNKNVEATLVLDTGASIMMLRRSVAQKLGINLDRLKPNMRVGVADGRQVPASLIKLDSVKVQNVEAHNVDASILLEDYGGLGMYDGLLGMSFLGRFAFKVDYKEGKLILEKK